MTITVSELVCQQDDLETYQTIEDQIHEMNTTVYELQESVEVKNTEIGRLISTQNNALADHANEFNEKIDSHSQKDIELKGEIDKLKDKTETLGNEHIEMNSATNSLKQTFEESSSGIGELIMTHQDALADHTNEFNDKVDSYDQKHTEFRDAIDELKENSESLGNEHSEIRLLIDNQAEKITAHTSNINNLIQESCPDGSNYRAVDGKCYYFHNVKLSTYEEAQANCAGKFPSGGRLFEPQSLTTNNNVLKESRVVIPEDNWSYIGVKRVNNAGDFKYVSSGLKVPFDIPWCCSNRPRAALAGQDCIYANNGGSSSYSLKWENDTCTRSWYSICEAV